MLLAAAPLGRETTKGVDRRCVVANDDDGGEAIVAVPAVACWGGGKGAVTIELTAEICDASGAPDEREAGAATGGKVAIRDATSRFDVPPADSGDEAEAALIASRTLRDAAGV